MASSPTLPQKGRELEKLECHPNQDGISILNRCTDYFEGMASPIICVTKD